MVLSSRVCAVLLSLCFMSSGCVSTRKGSASLDVISKETGLQFPGGTNVVGSYYEFGPGQGRYLAARLELTKTDFGVLLEAVPDTGDKERQVSDDLLPHASDWWHPDAVAEGRSMSYVRRNGDAVFLLVAPQDGRVTVFLYVSGG